MRKKIYGRKLSRGQGARKALFRSLIAALVTYRSIETTKAKAKAIQGLVDKIITIAKKDSVTSRRKILAILGNDRVTTKKLFEEISPVLSKRTGGYTRTIPLPKRRGDAAEMVRLEWVKEMATSDKRQATSKKKKGETKETSVKKSRIKLPKRKVYKKKESNKK